MKTGKLLAALGLALFLVGVMLVSYQARAQETGPMVVQSPQDDVGTGFSYQGRLMQNGTAYSGACDFRFTLYDDRLTPAKVAGPVEQPNVTVSDGYFSTFVDFGSTAFTGEGRQLGVEVRCPSDSGSYTPLSGYISLFAAPYALSLRPGAVISSSDVALNLHTSSTSSSALKAIALASSGSPAAVYGESRAPNGAGLAGYGLGSSNGVYGNSSSGVGVFGQSSTTGTVGIATATGRSVGVYGRNAGYSGAGVYGESDHTSGTGVRGDSDGGVGVEGNSGSGRGVVGSSTTGTGVWGYSASGYAIYSQGDTYIDGDLKWVTRTGYIALSAAAFQPREDGYDYTNNGGALYNNNGTSREYVAPVQLPHGSHVTKITFYWNDTSTSADGYCNLARDEMGSGTTSVMASASTNGSGGDGSSVDNTINYSRIDNSLYAYFLYLNLPDASVSAYGVVIEYKYTEPY